MSTREFPNTKVLSGAYENSFQPKIKPGKKTISNKTCPSPKNVREAQIKNKYNPAINEDIAKLFNPSILR